MTVTRAHITRQASADGVPAKTVERDYVLAHAIAAIAAHDHKDGEVLVFKGGTSLRLIHFEDYRYSADLDFSVCNASVEDALAILADAFVQSEAAQRLQLRLTQDTPPRMAYVGPLGRERVIKLDLADDEHVVHTEHRPLRPRWPDVPAVRVLVYTPLEVAAEKLRCVLQRLQCRDLFDMHVLFEEAGVDAHEAAALFRIKATHRSLDPAMFRDKYRTRIVQYEKRWERELSEHIPGELPHFNALERRVARHLRAAGLV